MMSVVSNALLSPSLVTMETANLSDWLKPEGSGGQPAPSTEDLLTSEGLSWSDSFPVSKEVQTYFQHIETRQCRTSSVGLRRRLKADQQLPILQLHNDSGQDSGVEDLGLTTPSSPPMSQNTLAQKDFMVYKRALLCAQFPVLSVPRPGGGSSPSTPSPYAYPISPPGTAPSHFTYLSAPRHSWAGLTPDRLSLGGAAGVAGRGDPEAESSEEEEVLVQNEMLAGVVRQAFYLNEERHRYYDEVIAEGMSRKAPARILIEELVSRLSVVENNRHPFYNPQAFEPRAYDIWQQGERRHIGELIETFWQFSLPSPVSTMVKPGYWQSVHQEYQELMVRLIRLDKTLGVNSYHFSMLSSASRRLLREFGLRYGVGELYRSIVFLEYIADKCHFECEVWYIEVVLKELSRLAAQLPPSPSQSRFVMVRHEFELVLDVLNKLHEHSKHGLQELLRIREDCSHKAVALVSLLSSVLTLKVQLTSRKGSSLDHFLEGYIKESAKQCYRQHKLRLETELNLNTYVRPISAELVSRLIGLVQQDIQCCLDFYQSVFVRYKQNITKLAATTFYANLLSDVNLVCEMTDIDKELDCINQDLVVLAQKLSHLDVTWKEYIPCHAQQWRQPMLAQAKSWMRTMSKQLVRLVVSVVKTDEFSSEFGGVVADAVEPDTKPKPRQSSILKSSPFSAFQAVSSPADDSPKRDGTQQKSPNKTKGKCKAQKSTDTSEQRASKGGSALPASVLYLNGGGDMKRIHSMPDIGGLESPRGSLRRTATTSDLEGSHTSSGQVRIHAGSSAVSFSSGQREPKASTSPSPSTSASASASASATACARDPSPRPEGCSEPDGTSEGSTTPDLLEVAGRGMVVGDGAALTKFFQTKLDSLNNNSSSESLSGNSTDAEKGESSAAPAPPATSSRGSDINLFIGGTPEESTLSEEVKTTLGTCSKSRGGRLEAEPMVSSSLSSSSGRRKSSSSSSASAARERSTSSSSDSNKNRAASVSFQTEQPGGSAAGRPQRFSASLVDVMFMAMRVVAFMQKLVGILCPADVEVPLGPGDDLTGSLSVRTFLERVRLMKSELKQMTEEAISNVLTLYGNNLLAMDLCATEKSQVCALVDEKVLYGILMSRQDSLLSHCRHEMESHLPCHHYMNRDSHLLCDKYEPITRQMCVRINNTWSVICLLPKLASMLEARARGRPPSASPSDDDQSQNRIYRDPVDQGVNGDSNLASGDHVAHLQNVLQAQINLLTYKLNLVLREALHVLVSPEFDSLTIADRLQPLTSCLHDHWAALGSWLAPDCLAMFLDRLWLCLVQDFEVEVAALKVMGERADNQAILLSQCISHLIEFLYSRGEGLSIDQLVKPAETVLNMLQLHSLPSKHLIRLYQKYLVQESMADSSTNPLPLEVIRTMYQALHNQRKCFSGHHMVTWLLVHFYKAQEKPAGQRIKLKRKAQQVGQKLLDMSLIQPVTAISQSLSDLLQEDLTGCSSDASLTDSTSSPYPAVTIHSFPRTSALRQSQELACESSEDGVEAGAGGAGAATGNKQRRRRIRRRISDFYSEEADSSDDSSASRPEAGAGRRVVLKAEVHVSADAEGVERSKSDNGNTTDRKLPQEVQGGEDELSATERQQGPPSSSESGSRTPVGKSLPGSSTTEDSSSSSSSTNRQASVPSESLVRSPSSTHEFVADTKHFYCFCDVDDHLFYGTSGNFGRSASHTTETSCSHHQRPEINAQFVLGVLCSRRTQNRLAREFTDKVPGNFWEEEQSSSFCCSCFK